jgi:ubiquinone/menaquinone biosynthesis C-methylase UbiE
MAKTPPRLEQFFEYYGRRRSRAEQRIEREVFGTDEGIISYTTVEQAARLAQAAGLGPGVRLLEVGAGAGWPGLHLARTTGCRAVLTDVPADAVRNAFARGHRRGLSRRCAFVVASGADLPFRARSFDAVVHSDVL